MTDFWLKHAEQSEMAYKEFSRAVLSAVQFPQVPATQCQIEETVSAQCVEFFEKEIGSLLGFSGLEAHQIKEEWNIAPSETRFWHLLEYFEGQINSTQRDEPLNKSVSYDNAGKIRIAIPSFAKVVAVRREYFNVEHNLYEQKHRRAAKQIFSIARKWLYHDYGDLFLQVKDPDNKIKIAMDGGEILFCVLASDTNLIETIESYAEKIQKQQQIWNFLKERKAYVLEEVAKLNRKRLTQQDIERILEFTLAEYAEHVSAVSQTNNTFASCNESIDVKKGSGCDSRHLMLFGYFIEDYRRALCPDVFGKLEALLKLLYLKITVILRHFAERIVYLAPLAGLYLKMIEKFSTPHEAVRTILASTNLGEDSLQETTLPEAQDSLNRMQR